MMNRGLMKRQMFARGGPVRMQQGGLAGISRSLQGANESLGNAQQQLQVALGSNGGMGSPMGGIMGLQAPQQRGLPSGFADMVGNPMGKIGAIQEQVAPPVGMEKGGAAFPDLTGDGEVTYADILKGRGVEMQMGGEPMMAQQAAMMQAPMPQDPSMDQAMAQAAQVGVDPAAVEGMLNQVSEGIGNLDDAEDFEQVMNSMRGNEAPISERYAELAEVVGEEDAEATPESVLALVQPVMQMAQVDQGIGGLAQEEMSAPVEGNMAGGIMSTVNMGEEVPAPVNFNQGGPVVAMAPGGVVQRVTTSFPEFQSLYAGLLGSPEEQQEKLEEQKRLTQSQMLFDIANTALAFASPGDRQMSAAERLADATRETQLFDKIGARAQSIRDFETKQEEAKRQLDTAALGTAISDAQSQIQAEAAAAAAQAKLDAAPIKDLYKVEILDKAMDGGILSNLTQFVSTQKELDDLKEEYGAERVRIQLVPKTPAKPDNQPVYGYNKKGFPVRLGFVNMDQSAAKVQQDITALSRQSLNNIILDKEQFDAEIRLNEYFQKGAPGQDRVALVDIEIEGPDGVKRRHEAGEIVRLNERQISALQGKTGPYEKKDLITIYSKTDIKSFTNTPEGMEKVEELLKTGNWSESSALFDANAAAERDKKKEENLRSRPETKIEDGNLVEIVKDTEGKVVSFKVLGPVKDKDLFNKSAAGLALKYFNSKNEAGESLMDLYAENKLTDQEDRIMESQITAYTTPVQGISGTTVNKLPTFVEDALVERVKKGLQVPVPLNSLPLPTELAESLGIVQNLTLPFGNDGKIDYSQFEDMPSIIIGDVDLSNAQGFVSGFKTFGNWIAGQAAEIGIGSGTFGRSGALTQTARKQLAALQKDTISKMRAAIDGKVFALDLALLKEETSGFLGGAANTDANALASLIAVRNNLAKNYNSAVKKLEYSSADPNAFSASEVEAAKKAKSDLEGLIGEYTAAIMSYKYAKAKSSGTGVKKRRTRKSETGL